ncbi:MAG: ATP-binding protein [Thermomicrobiales bacterium]
MTIPDPLDHADATVVLVGRETEQARLRDFLRAARAGRGGLVLIGGEAGIGKTTLAEMLCRDAERDDALVLGGRCYDLSETPPYGAWIDLFARFHPADDPLPLPEAFQQRGTVGAVASQNVLFQQVQAFFTTLARHRPLLVLLDDLHWADPASLDLLRFLARSLDTLPLLLLVTYRSDELTRRHPLYHLLPLLVREAQAERLDLQRIEEGDIRALIVARYALPEAEAERLVVYLQARSEGNPFFLGELLRTLEAARVLRQSGEGWTLGDLTQTRVPMLLRQVIDGRLARLDEEAQGLLAVAAVIGQEVSLVLWSLIAETDEGTLLAVVEQASDAHIMDESPDGAGVRFTHALIREAVYEGILPTRRRALHRRAGDALSKSAHPDPDAVVYHFRQSGDARLAVWLVQAGTRAWNASAEAAALACFEEALPLLTAPETAPTRYLVLLRLLTLHRHHHDGIPYGEEAVRVAQEMGDAMLEAAALLRVGVVRALNENHPRGLAEQERAVAMLTTFPDVARLRIYGGYFEDRGKGTLALTLVGAGRFAEAEPLARLDDRSGNGVSALVVCEAMFGRPNAARAIMRQHVTSMIPAADFRNRGSFWNVGVQFIAIPYLADDAAEVRRMAAAVEGAWAQAGEAVLGFPPRVAWFTVWIVQGAWAEAWSMLPVARHHRHIGMGTILDSPLRGMLARARGERALAWEMVAEMFPDGPATEPGTIPFRRALGLQETAAFLALDDRNRENARQWIEAHDRWLAWSGAVLGLSEGQMLWAEYYRQAGDLEKAYAHANHALAHATEPRQPLALLAAHRLLGELDTGTGKYADAATHLDTSLALADACAAPYERALTLLALAALHVATNKRAEAQAVLDEVRTICTPLDAKPALARADALVAALSDDTKTTPAYPAGLSAREVEVLRLVAEGLTNAQVAERLFLSPHTINSHLTAIYSKLGVPSRSAAIRFALEHDLQ